MSRKPARSQQISMLPLSTFHSSLDKKQFLILKRVKGSVYMEETFKEIGEYSSAAKNGEIWLKNKTLPPGSPQYFNEIEAGRFRYNYNMPKILDWCLGTSGWRFLKVGCGMGMDSACFAQNGFKTTSIDLAEAHVWLAKKFFKHKGLSGNFRLGNAENLPAIPLIPAPVQNFGLALGNLC